MNTNTMFNKKTPPHSTMTWSQKSLIHFNNERQNPLIDLEKCKKKKNKNKMLALCIYMLTVKEFTSW